MCKAGDGAAYVSREKDRPSGLWLQGILYYCQAWCLVTQNRPLFTEQILAWENGPFVASDLNGDPSNISPRDEMVIDPVLEFYGTLSGDELGSLARSEDPWRSSYNGVSGTGAAIIEGGDMASFYSRLSASDSETRAAHHGRG